ncbi:MAG: hypothetical protein ACP5T0_05350 [Verrucomicrobiia bacterium]
MAEIIETKNSPERRLEPIAFLTDAPPYLDGGHGCHVLSFNLIQVLKPYIRVVITRRMRRSVVLSKISENTGCNTLFYPDLSLLPSLGFLSNTKSFAEIGLFRVWIKRAAAKILESGAKRIFACCGADPFFLWVVEYMRLHTRLPVDIYLVDDFESSAILNGKPDFAKTVAYWEKTILKNADRIFTISKGFAEHIQDKLGLNNCRWLPIPILSDEQGIKYKPLSQNSGKKIAYFGAVNPLYLDEIRVLIQKIRMLNQETAGLNGTNGKSIISNTASPRYRLVIMSYTEPEIIYNELGKSEDFEFLHRASSEQCRKIMEESLAIFMPYTFRKELETMVSTSFPSRLAETIKIGRPLLVYGPRYASLPRYFIENNLNIVQTDGVRLTDSLKKIVEYDNPQTINQYECVIYKYHSPQAIMNVLAL